MGDSIEALIPKTQELLQPLIAKPKLADKLLLKPPFRFLHDIFTALTQATGFAKGLYNDFELDSANMKEKNQKITYLDKMVVCVGQCLGRDIDVRPAKIVAGLEAENTNLFLQALAQAASNASLDWAGAVQKTLAKIPSLTADGAPAPAATTPPADAKVSASAAAVPERSAAKERPSSSEAEKAAAAEAKAKEKVAIELVRSLYDPKSAYTEWVSLTPTALVRALRLAGRGRKLTLTARARRRLLREQQRRPSPKRRRPTRRAAPTRAHHRPPLPALQRLRRTTTRKQTTH